MAIDFGREICGDPSAAGKREWLVTNGLGGFASGTISGELTRRYHGLLIAARQPPLVRMLLVTKFDETIAYDGLVYPLFTNRRRGKPLASDGWKNLERFHLEGATPVWTYACADALLEKRIWMQPGENTTCVQYHLLRSSAAMQLNARALVNFRDYHAETLKGWRLGIEACPDGLEVTPHPTALPYYLLSTQFTFSPQHTWLRGFSLSVEQACGYAGIENHLHAANCSTALMPGETALIAFSTQPQVELDAQAAWEVRQGYEQELLRRFWNGASPGTPTPIEQLVLAADQFIVQRQLPGEPGNQGRSVIAGYPWFGDWGRDTMISLPGLTLATGRPEIARRILHTFAHYVDQGMLPNRFPDISAHPEYNTVDATLWYFEALRAYHTATQDDSLLDELFPVLEDILAWHQHGTRYSIHVDPQDGLLYAGEEGVQLTWMDVKIGDWVVTPRTGKAVEINALWHHALHCMGDFARRLGKPTAPFEALAELAQANFPRFWYTQGGYCYDVIDGPQGNDSRLRPNQIIAAALPHTPLPAWQQKAVVDICARRLLTSHGLRSLSPDDQDYIGCYQGNLRQRDSAYHQGTVWGWLIGPFISAHLHVYGDPAQARRFLAPLLQHLSTHGLGSISEIFDGEPPFTPRGCIAQAWSVAEALRAWTECKKYDEKKRTRR